MQDERDAGGTPVNVMADDIGLENHTRVDSFISLLLSGDPPDTGEATRIGQIPRDLRLPRRNPDRFETVRLGPADSHRLDRLKTELRVQRGVEWMSDERLGAAIWHLVCEVALDPACFRDEAVREAHVRGFLASVERPLARYNALIPVRHFEPPNTPVELGDVRVVTATDEVLDPFRSRLYAERLNAPLEVHRGRAMVLTQDWGTATEAVARRVRLRAATRLHMLRSCLGESADQAERLFQLGDITFVQPTAGPPGCAFHYRSGVEPRPLSVSQHQDRISQLGFDWARLQNCTTDIRESVARAHHWIGTGLMEPLPSRRIRDFATALEVLLILDERTAKRSWLAYRMCLLAVTLGQAMLHPTAVYVAYDARSEVTHKGRLELQTEESARHLHDAARDCACWLVNLASADANRARTDLLQNLDTPLHRDQVLSWLLKFDDPWSAELARELERLWKRHPCRSQSEPTGVHSPLSETLPAGSSQFTRRGA